MEIIFFRFRKTFITTLKKKIFLSTLFLLIQLIRYIICTLANRKEIKLEIIELSVVIHDTKEEFIFNIRYLQDYRAYIKKKN